MSKKGRFVAVQRFPEASATKWRNILNGSCGGEVFEALLTPQDSASQLQAVKKIGGELQSGDDHEVYIQVLVEVHCCCPSRHPLQRAINSVLLGLPKPQQRLLEGLLSANIQRLLQGERPGEGLTAEMVLASVQYVESLLENFAPGEAGLKLQLPLVLHYCTRAVGYCSKLDHKSYNISVFVEVMKVTMNLLQRFSLGVFPTILGVSPGDHVIQQVRAELLGTRRTCEQLLLGGDLPHDVIQAAAMLLVVISNVLNSTLPSTVEDGHKELLTNWLSHSDLKPFSKLALCYAFLAKIPASVLVGVVLRGEPLLLVLFPVICDLFDGFTESSSRYIASRVLTLWSSTARECVLNGEEASIVHSLSPTGSLVHKLLQYVWCLWEDPIDGIRHHCKEIFENVIKIHHHHGPAGDSALLGLAQRLISLNSPTRGKFILLSSLVHHVSADQLVSAFPAIPEDLLSVMGHQALACHAGDLWTNIVCRHWQESYKDKDKVAVWSKTWVLPLLGALCTLTPLARRHISQHCLPALFRCDQSCMEYVDEHLKDIDASPDGKTGAHLACLRTAKVESKLFSRSLESTDSIFQSSMHHSEEQILLSALSLVCESVKTTDAPPPSHLKLLLDFIELNGNSQSPCFREPALSSFKKILNRIKESAYQLMKRYHKGRGHKGCGPDPTLLIQSYKQFLQDLLDQQFGVLHPLSSFQRRNFSLSILHLMASCFQSPGADEAVVMSHVFSFPEAVSEAQALGLLAGLRDPYDANRVLCLSLLLQIRMDKFGLSKDFVNHCTTEYLSLVCQPKSASCAAAAAILKFLVAMVGSEFNQHFAQLLDEEVLEDTPHHLATLNLLCCLLKRHISAAQADLLAASMTTPMYGVLQSIRAVLETSSAHNMDASDERWRQVLCQLVSLCECLSEVVSPVVCSSSPEGLLLEGDGKSSGTDPSSVGGGGSDDNDPSTVGSAQSLLLCCWHTMKEVSLLLGYLVENWNVVGPTKTLLLAQEQMETIAGIFIHQLTEARHRGAFEMAYTGFYKLCGALWTSPLEVMCQKPRHWVQELLDSLQSSSVAKLLSVTRRSAGLPFFLQAILATEPPQGGRACLKSAMEVLLKVAHEAVQVPAPSTTPPSGLAQPAAVHALNILRALYKDSRLGEHLVSFIPDGVGVAITGFAANLWPVRNSSNLLFAALVLRIFGAKRVSDEHSMENKMTGREFFTRFPTLHGYLLQSLRHSVERLQHGTEGGEGTGHLQPSLFPVLLLLSRLYPSPLDDPNSSISLTPFIPLLIRCTCCSLWKTRVLVARGLSLMLTQQNCVDILGQLYGRMCLSDQNSLHGLLLVVSRVIQDQGNLVLSPVDHNQEEPALGKEEPVPGKEEPTPGKEESVPGKTVSLVLLELHLEKWWIGWSDNACGITRTLYLDMLCSLLELLQPQALEGLTDQATSHLRAFHAHALGVCTCGREVACDECLMLQHVRLLTLSSCYPNVFPTPSTSTSTSTSASTSAVLVGVLRWCKDASLFAYSLRRLKGVGEGESVMETLVSRANQECDPDILIHIYEYFSTEGGAKSHAEELVPRANQLFQEHCSRIELRVALIHYLPVALTVVHSQDLVVKLLGVFEKLTVQTQPFQIREGVAANVMKLWPLVVKAGDFAALHSLCKLTLCLLQDADADVRSEIATAVGQLLTSAGRNELGSLNPSSALRHFISALPHLLPSLDTSWELLPSLLPPTRSTTPTANPLFDEDPVNDYAEEVVLMQHLVGGMRHVLTGLTQAKQLSVRHYDILCRHLPPAPAQLEQDCSVWGDLGVFMNTRKYQLLFPLMLTVSKEVKGHDLSDLEEMVKVVQIA